MTDIKENVPEIKINVPEEETIETSNNSYSERKEEQWNDTNENFIRELMKDCMIKADQHSEAEYYYKRLKPRLEIPSVVLSVIFAPILALLDCDSDALRYVGAGSCILINLFATMSIVNKFGEKMVKHSNFSARYADVVSDIRAELVRGKKFRTQFDVFNTKINMIIDNLNNTARTLPKHIADSDKYEKRIIN